MKKIILNRKKNSMHVCDTAECCVCSDRNVNKCKVCADFLDGIQLIELSSSWTGIAAMCEDIYRSLHDNVHSDNINLDILIDDLNLLSKTLKKQFRNSADVTTNLMYRYYKSMDM